MDIKIDTNIPIPSVNKQRGREKQPDSFLGILRSLQVGESFTLPTPDRQEATRLRNKCCSSFSELKRQKVNHVFTIRTLTEDGNQVLRIWRIQ